MIRRCSLLGLFSLLILIIDATPAVSITWGEIDEDNYYDNVCMIGVSVNIAGNYEPITTCSGTLIHGKAVLTAGHCIEYIQSLEGLYGNENVLVEVFFNYDLTGANPGDGLAVAEHIVHPDYPRRPPSSPSPPYDVGILTFEQPVEDIEPAELPYQGFLDELKVEKVLGKGLNKGKFIVVGYGSTVDWPPPVVNYNDSFIRRYAEGEYRALLPTWLRLSQNQATDDGGSCFGDSGGPVFWTDQVDGEEIQIFVGITSWGDPNCISSSFNYRVDIPRTLEFIQSVLLAIDEN